MRDPSLHKFIRHLRIPLILCLFFISFACTPGGGGLSNLGGGGGDLGAGGGGIGTPPPGTPPGGIGGPGPGDGGGGGGGGGGGNTSGGSAVPPLDAGIVGPSTDVGSNSNPKASVDVSICSFEDKVKIHLEGQAYYGNAVTGITYYENGRVLRVVDRLGKEFIETKIFTSTREGLAHILITEKGHFDVTMILDHLPVEIVNHPLAVSTLLFYITDEDYESSGPLDQMQSCPAQGNCFDAAWTVLERPYFDQKFIEEAKTFKACGLSLRRQAPIQLIQ